MVTYYNRSFVYCTLTQRIIPSLIPQLSLLAQEEGMDGYGKLIHQVTLKSRNYYCYSTLLKYLSISLKSTRIIFLFLSLASCLSQQIDPKSPSSTLKPPSPLDPARVLPFSNSEPSLFVLGNSRSSIATQLSSDRPIPLSFPLSPSAAMELLRTPSSLPLPFLKLPMPSTTFSMVRLKFIIFFFLELFKEVGFFMWN